MKFLIFLLLLRLMRVLAMPYQMFNPEQNPELVMKILREQVLQQQMQSLRPYEMDYEMQWQHPQPVLILIIPMATRTQSEANSDNLFKNTENQDHFEHESDSIIQENEDSVIVGAKPETINLPHEQVLIATPYQGKYILGQIIMAIPFLPFEVNVPDTVSWAWNGISGIIAGIGQRWPFNRPMQTQEEANEVASKLLYKHLFRHPIQKSVMPIFVVSSENFPFRMHQLHFDELSVK